MITFQLDLNNLKCYNEICLIMTKFNIRRYNYSFIEKTTGEILNNLIDLLKASSYIEINDYTINILKNSINPYFDTITYKLINNWNVVIENILLYWILNNCYGVLNMQRNM